MLWEDELDSGIRCCDAAPLSEIEKEEALRKDPENEKEPEIEKDSEIEKEPEIEDLEIEKEPVILVTDLPETSKKPKDEF